MQSKRMLCDLLVFVHLRNNAQLGLRPCCSAYCMPQCWTVLGACLDPVPRTGITDGAHPCFPQEAMQGFEIVSCHRIVWRNNHQAARTYVHAAYLLTGTLVLPS